MDKSNYCYEACFILYSIISFIIKLIMSQPSKIKIHHDPFSIIYNYRHLPSAEKRDKKLRTKEETYITKIPFILTRKMAAEI